MTARGAAVVVLVAALSGAATGQAGSFRSQFKGPTRALGDALADTVARSLPVLSASPGLTFTYDPASGAMVRDTDLLGQLYLERPRTIGKGRWNLNLSYQRVNVDSVQGQDLDGLSDDDLAIVVGAGRSDQQQQQLFQRIERWDVALTVDMVTLAATYGLSERIDLSLALPILASRLSIDGYASTQKFDPNGPRLVTVRNQPVSPDLSQAGIGDIFLRGKYHFLTSEWGDLATGLNLRLPTGSQDDFQGTGDWELSPMLYASTPRIGLGRAVFLQGFFNGGLDLNLSDVDHSAGRFGAGIDLGLGQRATLSVAFLGREPFHSFTPAGFFDLPRFRPRNPNACKTRPNDDNFLLPDTCPMAPLFGLSTARASYYSLSIGGRVSLWRDTVFGFANVLIPLNDQGIHTDPIPLVGFEATF